ncbi:hypothetical protein E4U42_003977 [Claviceps africana]|uniref:Mediator of RNA polymerase II transcription subunit 13 n=1 Tax=Claviceps africana TaxID=83212 RepID=A0A8K0NKS3_9HYPO|nr:hypothetical protein E4U42_003977 [Claviceps africana]
MDTAEYDTNTLVLNKISSISFRVYEPIAEQSQTFGSTAIEIESRLREQGHIVYYDAGRRCIWIFRVQAKDEDGDVSADVMDRQPLGLHDHSLIVGEEGLFDPSSLQKPRVVVPQAGPTPTSSTPSASVVDQSQRQTLVSAPQPAPSRLQEQDQNGLDSSTADSKSTQGEPTSSKIIYENFMVATLLTISTAFSKRSGSIPLDYRTVLLSEQTLGNDSFGGIRERRPTIGTFKAYTTTTGSLVLSMSLSICRGMLLPNTVLNQGPGVPSYRVLAAPFGMIASNQLPPPFEGGTASMAQTPNTQALSLRGAPDMHDSLWRHTCLKFLQLRGIARSRLADCAWTNLVVPKPKLHDTKVEPKRLQQANSTVTFPWPGPLCFGKKPVEVLSTSRIGDSLLSGHEECHDPLGNAQAWFSSTAEREEKILKRRQERTAALQEAVILDPRPLRPNGQSPLTIRRPSTTAAGSMYPTPPDALQSLSGVTPSLDGTLSSPGNPLSTAAVPDADHNNSNSAAMAGPYDSGQDYQDSKRQRGDGQLLGESEHMFGDMGGDMFGDNDITEDDFNFFDEEPGGMNLDATMASMSGGAVETSMPSNQNSINEEAASTVEVRKQDPCREETSTVFTKPELRHAISAQNEMQRGRESKRVSVKRESSPFDPHTVFKKVRASLGVAERASRLNAATGIRRTKKFEKVDFDPRLPLINKKYEQGGQFDYSKNAVPERPKLDLGSLPKTDYLKRQRHGKQNRRTKDDRLQTILGGSLTGLEPPIAGSSPVKLEVQISDGEQSTFDSEQDDSSFSSDHEPLSPVKSSVRHAPAADDDAASHVTSLKELDALEEPDHQLAAELPRLYKPETPETPLSVLFCDPEPLSLELSLGDEDLIQVAQILTEQAATGTLHLCAAAADVTSSSIVEQNQQSLLVEARASLQLLREIAPTYLPGIASVHLKEFLDIQDVPFLNQLTRIQPRPVPGRDANAEQQKRPSNLYQIPAPHLEVRRSDGKLSVLPSAITFWESLGLGPSSGSKEITAVCIFPGWKGMKDNAKTFLGRVKSVYEVLKLGSMDNMVLSPDMDDGILAYEVDRISTSPDATVTGHGSALVSSMEVLRGALENLTVSYTNVVVFFVYSPSNPGSIVEACAAFQRFFDSYQRDLTAKKEPAANELVLQLVSADVLSSPTSVVITPSQDLVKLCMETYDRCTLFGGPMPAPAIRLEQALPRIIEFKLMHTPSASLIRENSCIHVGYAQTVDERWITAAWTDDRGNQQATASYCLGRKGRPASRSTSEVAHEIWDSTLDLVSAWKVHWRIIITKCGPMDQHEVEFWTDLARTEIKASVSMMLVTVDTNPSLQLMPPMVKLPQVPLPFYTTPVSTPQTNMVLSPEQSATPGGLEAGAADAADTDAILTDVTDQTWGAISWHRLNSSGSVLDLHPALISGYLIKRTGARIEDALMAMEVNLVHTDASPRSYEPLLREILSCFRGLAALSRARGVVARDTDVRPWHIAAAEKASRALYLLM